MGSQCSVCGRDEWSWPGRLHEASLGGRVGRRKLPSPEASKRALQEVNALGLADADRTCYKKNKLLHCVYRDSMVFIAFSSSHCYLRSSSRTSRTFSFPDSRDPLEVLGGLSWHPPSLSAKKVLREPREGPENLGSRRSWWSKIMNPSNNDYWVDNSALIRPLEELLH